MKNIIMTLKNFFKSFFAKNDKLIDEAKVEENYKQISTKSQDSYFDEMRTEIQRRNYLLKIKQIFENGEISESEISEKNKKGIEELYYEQIQSLNRKIRNAKKS